MITHAQTVLYWQENLTEEEMPPAWMWPFSSETEPWFDRIRAERQERYGIGRGEARVDAPNMEENELARPRRR